MKKEVEINTMEIIEELKREIAELTQTKAILTIKCRKLEEQIDSCGCKEDAE